MSPPRRRWSASAIDWWHNLRGTGRRIPWRHSILGLDTAPSQLPAAGQSGRFNQWPMSVHDTIQPPSQDQLLRGSMLGGLRIERRLARGGSGALLYLAFDPSTHEPFALKTFALALSLEGSREAAREHFMRESRLVASLRHPDIVRVHAAGEEAGHAYLVMELLPGSDLARYTRAHRLLPEPVVLDIVARVAAALGYAHAQGVLHRDVKPANVMVDFAADRVTITDFGVASLAQTEHQRGAALVGSPATMAPEQLTDSPVDARADLYAVGVMLFQLLTARLPYHGHTVEQLVDAIVNDPPMKLASLRPDLPAALSEYVDLLLHKLPERRPRTGEDVAATLRSMTWPVRPQVQVGAS
jgi:eukaryotic-like serine/threonine-protein kinase